jgi:hypothetical protein
MRITPEILRKIARDTVTQRTRSNRDLLAVYLVGSLLTDDPLIGGATDIDLVFIYNGDSPLDREIIRLTDDVHLDIAHHSRYIYHQTRELRVHPWMGPNIYNCKILYDPQHFMDFTQASVSGQYNQPENVLQRAGVQVEQARQTWLAYQLEAPEAGPAEIGAYLKAVGSAANALASLSGPPLADRRLLLEFPSRAEAVGRRGLEKGLTGLLGGQKIDGDQLKTWIPQWKEAVLAIPDEMRPIRLHPHRIPYYQRAFEAAIASGMPQNALWALLTSWNQAITLHDEVKEQQVEWQAAMEQLHLFGSGFQDRLAALDAFLDTIEDVLDGWGQSHGVLPT